MGALVVVVCAVADGAEDEFDSALLELRSSLASEPPRGMLGFEVLRTTDGPTYFLLQAHWARLADHQTLRDSPRGGRLFERVASCCREPPETYRTMLDERLSLPKM
jgi:quinol monooxygenase YgiN